MLNVYILLWFKHYVIRFTRILSLQVTTYNILKNKPFIIHIIMSYNQPHFSEALTPPNIGPIKLTNPLKEG